MCKTKYCRNRTTGDRTCKTCLSRRYRESDPLKYAYHTLRTNTIRRKGRAWFELTFEEFAKFAYETKYLAGKGRKKMSYSIDRIDNTMGYFIGNIRILTLSDNSKKHTRTLHYEYDYLENRMVAHVTSSSR